MRRIFQTICIVLTVASVLSRVNAQNTVEELLEGISNQELIQKLNQLNQSEDKGYQDNLEKELFRRSGCEPENKDGRNLYHYIGETGALEFLKLNPKYLKNRYSINAKTKYGKYTPVHLAILKNNVNSIETIEALRNLGADLSIVDDYSNSYLILAAKNNNILLVKYFIDNGLDINARNRFRNSALHFAVANKNKEMVDYLVSRGAELDEVNFRIKGAGIDNYSTIFHSAALYNWFDILDLCLKKGLDIDCKVATRNAMNATPLYGAVAENDLKAVEYLLTNGADVNAMEQTYGYTPLTMAIHNQNLEIFDLVMKYHPNVNIPTPALNGFPIYHCFKGEDKEKNKYFAEAIVKDANFLLPGSDEAGMLFNKTYSDILVVRGKINMLSGFEKDVDDKSPLHWCASLGWTDLCELLIENGVKVDVLDKIGNTPLQLAVANKKHDAVKLLIENGADPKLENNNKETAFDIAKSINDNEMKMLLKGK